MSLQVITDEVRFSIRSYAGDKPLLSETANNHQKAVFPPFTPIICPITNFDFGDARNRMASAISSGIPSRFAGMITIRLLAASDAERFKSLRLLAVESSPTSIWPTRKEEMARSIEQTTDRIQATPTQAVFGAFDGEVLAGITGIRREPLQKVTHKATIWGVFVKPSYRGRGIAQALRQRTQLRNGAASS